MASVPLGLNKIEIERGLTTSSTAIFVPFTTQELFQDGEALYYGLNALSNNMIMVDRKRLKNPNGLIKVIEAGYKGITVEGNYNFYNKIGFKTSSEYNIYPTSGYPMIEPRCMMCQETYEGSLSGINGYVVYDMYYNA